MSNDGESILKLIKHVRQLCEQISLLLRTADEQMKKSYWETESNTAIADSSQTILNPAGWIPINVFQFYRHKDRTNRLAYISVLLDDHWDRKYIIKEPLVTAGFVDSGNAVISGDEYWYARFYGHLSKDHNLKPDGTPFHFEKTMLASEHQKGNFERGKVFAVPLVSITSPSDVASQITNRLLGLLKDET